MPALHDRRIPRVRRQRRGIAMLAALLEAIGRRTVMRGRAAGAGLVLVLLAACGVADSSTTSLAATAEPSLAATAEPSLAATTEPSPVQSTPPASAAAAVSCPGDPTATDPEATPVAPTPDMTIADLLRADARFERFCRLAEQTMSPGLGRSWLEIWNFPGSRMGDNQDGVTVFVPTDEAFEKLDPVVLSALEQGDVSNELRYSLLGHHFVSRLYPAAEFEPGPQPTWSGAGSVELELDPITFGGCAVVQTDVRVENGYVHVIDCVVIPDDFADAISG